MKLAIEVVFLDLPRLDTYSSPYLKFAHSNKYRIT